MAKGYWIAHVDVVDEAKYDAYRAANGAAIKKYGGRFLVRGGDCQTPDGTSRSRHVVIEFPSYQAARDCYRSAEYAQAKAARGDGAEIDLIIIDGYDEPQS